MQRQGVGQTNERILVRPLWEHRAHVSMPARSTLGFQLGQCSEVMRTHWAYQTSIGLELGQEGFATLAMMRLNWACQSGG